MVEATWLLRTLAAASTLAGFAWLALAMDVHWRQVHGGRDRGPMATFALRGLGSVGLVASAALCFTADRPSMAVLVWVMLLAGAVPLVAVTLAWRPRLLKALWPRGSM